MIDRTEDLTALVERGLELGHVAIDTEFVWERTYYARLGVVQIGFSRDECYLIDAPAIEDLTPLGRLLSAPGVVKILHDAQQDLMILRHNCGACATNVFDTRCAAGFVGLTSTLSLDDLLRDLVGVQLSDGQTRSDWLKRPLTTQQVQYALEDVRYLTQARDILLSRAREAGREAWIGEELAQYDDPALYEDRDARTQFSRVKGAGRLSGRQLAVLRELAAWREDEARGQDRPRGHIIADEILVSIARRTPKSHSQLGNIRGRFDAERYGDDLLRAVQVGLKSGDLPTLGNGERPENEHVLNARVDFALAYMKGKGLREGVDPQLLATRSELTALVAAGPDASPEHHGLLRGWRREFLGDELLTLLAGEGLVYLDPAGGLPMMDA